MGVTLDQVIDRLYRDHLTPPDEQLAQTTLDGALTIDTTTVTLTDSVLTQEEEDAIGAGTIIEVDQELFRVTAVAWPVLTVATRPVLGTEAATHSDKAPVLIKPKYPRAGVFEAVCDAIENLNGDLFATVTSDTFSTVESLVEVPAVVKDIVELKYRSYEAQTSVTRYVEGGVEFQKRVPADVSATGKCILMHGVPTGRTAWYVYVTDFTRPDDETYDLTDDGPNFETRWIPLILLGALIDILFGSDIPARTTEYITDALEAQGWPVGSGETVDRALVRIYEYRLGQAKKRLNRDFPMRVEQMQVIS